MLEVCEGLERPEPLTEADSVTRQKEGVPLVPVDLVFPDGNFLRDAAKSLLEVAREHEVLDEDEVEAVTGKSDELDVVQLAGAVATRNTDTVVKLADELCVAADALLFIGEHLARAVLKWHAGPLQETLDDEIVSRKGDCPICGNLPRIATLSGEEGSRSLVCGMCESGWRYKRIGCPYCGCEEQSKLRHFTVENEPNYRVGVCDSCKRYLKQVDLRKLRGEPAALTDLDVASARLDLLAWREGYR